MTIENELQTLRERLPALEAEYERAAGWFRQWLPEGPDCPAVKAFLARKVYFATLKRVHR